MATPKEMLKEILRRIHAGEDPDRLQSQFREVLRQVGPEMIGRVEEDLIREGIPREEIHRLCDVHLRILKGAIEGAPGGEGLPPWHPLHTFMEEHDHLQHAAEELASLGKRLAASDDPAAAARARELGEFLGRSESHYVREENVLFPLLEKHGITEPPKVMWAEHDDIRPLKKLAHELATGGASGSASRAELATVAEKLAAKIADHFYKENNVLYKMALRVVEPSEWIRARRESDEIGYCCHVPPPVPASLAGAPASEAGAAAGPGTGPAAGRGAAIEFATGHLTPAEIEGILNTIPAELSFVDRDGKVKFYSEPPGERLFPRTKAVIGRTVQNCHPPKSVHMVEKIIDAFRKGERDVAAFWIPFQGRFVHIRYFAVRDKERNYLGVLEVAQDVTEIRALEGERRLLDWEG